MFVISFSVLSPLLGTFRLLMFIMVLLILLLLVPPCIIQSPHTEILFKVLLNVAICYFCLCLLKRIIIDGPLYSDWLCDSSNKHLIMHSFSREFRKVSVCELYISTESSLIKVNVFDFSVRTKMFIQKPNNILYCHTI